MTIDQLGLLLLGAAFLVLFFIGVASGEMPAKGLGYWPDRDEQPYLYWASGVFNFAAAAFLISAGLGLF